MATKDELIEENATLRTKVAELEIKLVEATDRLMSDAPTPTDADDEQPAHPAVQWAVDGGYTFNVNGELCDAEGQPLAVLSADIAKKALENADVAALMDEVTMLKADKQGLEIKLADARQQLGMARHSAAALHGTVDSLKAPY